jgi:hypothetical protein
LVAQGICGAKTHGGRDLLDRHLGRFALPTLGSMIAEEIGGIDVEETEARLDGANTALLWGEPAPAR